MSAYIKYPSMYACNIVWILYKQLTTLTVWVTILYNNIITQSSYMTLEAYETQMSILSAVTYNKLNSGDR